MIRLKLTWEYPETGALLKFDKYAWALLQSAADKRGIEPEEMISVAVARLVGKISNYRLKE